jgi:hypothetical protein
MFKSAGAAAIGYVAVRSDSVSSAPSAHPSEAAPADELPGVGGKIERLELPATLIISNPNGPVTVRLAPDARLSRGHGPVALLSAFVPGDQVFAEGHWDGPTFTATAVSSIYHFITDHVVARRGNQLQTTTDLLYLAPATIPARGPNSEKKPLVEIRTGDHIEALTWTDPVINRRWVAMIGVAGEHVH